MQRCPRNPILTRKDIPAIAPQLMGVSSVFNPGAVMFGEKILLMLRVQNRARETFFLTATSLATCVSGAGDAYRRESRGQFVQLAGAAWCRAFAGG